MIAQGILTDDDIEVLTAPNVRQTTFGPEGTGGFVAFTAIAPSGTQPETSAIFNLRIWERYPALVEDVREVALRFMEAYKVHRLVTLIPQGARAALPTYQKIGFNVVGKFRRVFEDSEDGYLLDALVEDLAGKEN